MHEDVIREFLKKELIKDKGSHELGITEDLISSGIIDSMGIQRLLVFLENNFSIQIAEDELVPDNFETIEKISCLVDRKVN